MGPARPTRSRHGGRPLLLLLEPNARRRLRRRFNSFGNKPKELNRVRRADRERGEELGYSNHLPTAGTRGLPGPRAVPSGWGRGGPVGVPEGTARHALRGNRQNAHVRFDWISQGARTQPQGRSPATRRVARAGRLPIGRPATRRSRVENYSRSRAPARHDLTQPTIRSSAPFGLSPIPLRASKPPGDKAGGSENRKNSTVCPLATVPTDTLKQQPSSYKTKKFPPPSPKAGEDGRNRHPRQTTPPPRASSTEQTSDAPNDRMKHARRTAKAMP